MTGQHPLVGVGPRDVVPLTTLVDGWLKAGLITAEQAARLTTPAALPAAAPRREGVPLVAEALAYVGGAVVVAGTSLLTAYYWRDLAAEWRFVLLAVVTALLVGAGAAVPRRLGEAGRRLRGVLWLAATPACAGATTVLVVNLVDRFADDTEAVLVAAATTALAAVLWALHRFGLQQLAVLVSGAVLVGTGIQWSGLGVEPGVGVWLLGVAWAVLGVVRVIRPTELPLVLGSATAVFGSMTAGDSDAGMVFVLVTVAAVVGTAIARHDLLLLGVGALATMVNVPAAMSRWFAGSVPAATALVVVGLLLVAVAVWMTRRQRPAPPR
jgi:hypothetical protein